MNSNLKIDPNKLHIFHELRKRRIYVGELTYNETKDVYQLQYDKDYVNAKNAIPIGPDLDLFKMVHVSQKGQLFPVFLDRIPEKTNPAYKDYCLSQGIFPNEQNKIILLGSIGIRGASSFIFEPVYKTDFVAADLLKIREELQITQYDLAIAFDINQATLQRIEAGVGSDKNTIKLLQIYFSFPDIALWQLRQTREGIHASIFSRLIQYCKKRIEIKMTGEFMNIERVWLENGSDSFYIQCSMQQSIVNFFFKRETISDHIVNCDRNNWSSIVENKVRNLIESDSEFKDIFIKKLKSIDVKEEQIPIMEITPEDLVDKDYRKN